MKRKWSYLGAVLPLSVAVSAWATAEAALEDAEKMSRSKSGPWQDEGDEKSAAPDGSSPLKESPGIKAPPRDAHGDDGPRAQANGGFDPASGAGSPGVQISVPNTDGSMYAPAAAQDGSNLLFASGSGGPLAKTELQQGEAGEQHGTEAVPATDPLPVVEPDLSDDDAMLILLGGLASGSGTGATSSGEIVFDMVDYGLVTVGYGFATFMAAGSDGATADTFAGVTGADLAFSFTTNDWGDDSAASTTYVLAIDFEGDLIAGDPAFGNVDWKELMGQDPFFQWLGGAAEEDVSVNGNIALGSFSGEVPTDQGPLLGSGTILTIDELGSFVTAWLQSDQASLNVQAEAHGIDTLVQASGGLLQIEDHFSSVNGSVIAIG